MVNLTTIEYDRPVANYIAQLNATGHVTHVKHKKTGVTFHHNGGGPNFSHQTILNIWKTRPASAHFDVDGKGDIAQYINAYEYAWACASTRGNQITDSIELANSTLAPGWHVSKKTWKAGARLAAWLFLHIIQDEPTSKNIYFHHDWYPTACAGPYMDKIRSKLVREVQHQYQLLKTGKTAPAPPKKKDDDMPEPPKYSYSKKRPLKKGANLVQIDELKNGKARYTAGPTDRAWCGISELSLYLDGVEPGQTIQVRAVCYRKNKAGKWVPGESEWLDERQGTPGTTCIKETEVVTVAKGERLRWEVFLAGEATQVKARCDNLVWKD